jgi:hypothetical protein
MAIGFQIGDIVQYKGSSNQVFRNDDYVNGYMTITGVGDGYVKCSFSEISLEVGYGETFIVIRKVLFDPKELTLIEKFKPGIPDIYPNDVKSEIVNLSEMIKNQMVPKLRKVNDIQCTDFVYN